MMVSWGHKLSRGIGRWRYVEWGKILCHEVTKHSASHREIAVEVATVAFATTEAERV